MLIRKTLAFVLCATYLTTSPVFSMDLEPEGEDWLTTQHTRIALFAGVTKDDILSADELSKMAGRIVNDDMPLDTLHPDFLDWISVIPTENLTPLLFRYKKTLLEYGVSSVGATLLDPIVEEDPALNALYRKIFHDEKLYNKCKKLRVNAECIDKIINERVHPRGSDYWDYTSSLPYWRAERDELIQKSIEIF